MVLLVIGAGILGWYLQDQPPEISDNSLLELKLEGDIPEQVSPDITAQILEGVEPVTFIPLLREIEKAAADTKITGILLKPSGLGLGWAKLQQLRRALELFQSKGKRVVAWMGTGGAKEYYLASVADRIYLSPVGVLDLKGMRAEVMFFKDGLEKIGVDAELERIGEYKNMADQFTENRMTDAFREATTAMLDSVYGNYLNGIGTARKRPVDEMRELIEQSGPFEAERALSAGLVDQLLYEDELVEQIGKEMKIEKEDKVSLGSYSKVSRESVGLDGKDRLAVIYAVGSITSGEDGIDPLSGKSMGSETMISVLEEVMDDESIKGAVLRIDSPGGDAFASEDIWRAVMKLREKKPMVISMSDVAASGGYLIAMTGDPVIAERTTLTGSIGIIYGKLNLKGLYDKLGIHKEIISRGKFANLDSDYGPYTPEERNRVQALMEDFYGKFINKVAAARKMTPEDVDKVAQGRVWTGEQALEHGLVDELGGMERSLEILKEKVGLPLDASVELVEFPRHKSLMELIIERMQGNETGMPAAVSRWLLEGKFWEKLSINPYWARIPYAVEFH
ncbi:MAG: signal peptide peptidase SppA [Acidobacteria bacterium RIFCSPLOWO2_12_FULL_54_10]|nr:MAG: signal peptide peptidase SppA [Acidobacteria bacterium RIFCSPLOWO2_12_FULL_54_10]